MAGPGLPVNIDSTYADDAGDASVKYHQQYHDSIHGIVNAFDTSVASASTNGSVLEWSSSSSSYIPVMTGYYDMPTDLGFKSWSLDPRLVSATVVPTAGVVYVQRQRFSPFVASGSNVGVQIYVGIAGTGTQALVNCFVGLYRADNSALLATSATQATAWATTGVKDVTLTLTADKPASVDFYTAFVIGTQSTTPCQIGKGAGASTAALANGKGLTLFGNTGTSQTSLPATLGSLSLHASTYFLATF